MPDLSPLGWLLATAAVLAVVAGVRRSRYDGIPLVVWWRQERMYRRPGRIVGRLAKVVFGALLLTASILALLILVGVAIGCVALVVLLLLVWYGLRLAARRSTPHVYPVERLDVDLSAGQEPPVIWPPGSIDTTPGPEPLMLEV